MSPRSPFEGNRWENDDQHIIWLPLEFQEWERKRCVYFTGSRGSGKTTLLRAFEWKERLNNESLREQLGPDPFSKRYIGVYLNTPSYITNRFVDWPLRKEYMNNIQWEEERGRLYSLYLEYQILQLLIEAIQGLRGKSILKFSPEEETQSVKYILSERPEINNFISQQTEKIGLNDLRLCFKFMHENIRYHAINNLELKPERGYPPLQMGKNLEEITKILIDLCQKGFEEDSQRWLLKVCIDQTESIEPYQLKAINTMVVGLEKGDISFIISSLSGTRDISDTFIPRHPLTYADRMHVSLEKIYRSSSKFNELIAAVTNLRFKRFIGKNDVSVDLKYILGESDINSLLYDISFKRSEKEEIKKFIKKSQDNINKEFFKIYRKTSIIDTQKGIVIEKDEEGDLENLDEYLPVDEIKLDIPPFYHTYLIEKLDIEIPEMSEEKYKLRSLKSRVFRKKMVSAMLCLCKEYDVKIPYSGYNMVISMSDQSIRDFLLQMHEIYLAENINAEKFAKKQISPIRQNKAIRKASDSRFERVGKEAEARTKEIERLVLALGKITAIIQSAYNYPSSLRTIERGRYEIIFKDMPREKEADLKEILNLAEDCHCIKMIDENLNRVLIRLHRLFAPKFGFSYRGAYSNVTLPGEILLNLCEENDDHKREKHTDIIIRDILENRKIESETVTTLDRWSK